MTREQRNANQRKKNLSRHLPHPSNLQLQELMPLSRRRTIRKLRIPRVRKVRLNRPKPRSRQSKSLPNAEASTESRS